ncbi:zinc finger matrin-type protein CG9776 isoform X2 [Frankliniella occidentalis]|uniref:Zinc finger matrin-type protein CG9776 isoform X2 n=1 Tax=Frankliniella occidentalis TaxID=133901 RepID=A0A9C6X0M5_FRAOC|nr:zinc finger matrin-type protein CG9776 isoform X2 [Frankliniella occidentalis]
MEKGRFVRDGRDSGRGRGRWNTEGPTRGRFRGGDRSSWGNHGGRDQRDQRDRRYRSPQGRRSRSHSPHRKRMRSRSTSSRSRSSSGSPARNRRNYSRSTSPRNRGRNASHSRSKSPPNRPHMSTSGYAPQDPFRGPQPPGVDSPVIRQQYAAPFQHTSIPPPGVPPPQGHPPGPPPGYPGYDSYYQHQPPPSLYPPGVPDYIATQAPSTMTWSAPEYSLPSSAHLTDMKHNSNAAPAPVPVPVPIPQPSHDSSSINIPPPPGTGEESHKKEAIERELRTQKENLVAQREEYIRKSKVFERELGLLRGQEEELSAENSRDNERIIHENHKLQVEIQNKLKAINNVIDMLTGIIGDSKELAQKRVEMEAEKGNKKKPKSPHSRSQSSGQGRSRSSSSSDSSADESKEKKKQEIISPEEDFQKYNYIHFDPENHWCRVCNVFPRTAKEYLHHLHSAEHKDQITVRKLVDMPWHKDHPAEEVPQVPGAPTKRTPIKGIVPHGIVL